MGQQGTSVINFGAFPGASDASVAVTGQSGILAGSLVEAWIYPVATSDHSADEHNVETIKITAGNVVAGTGFTIYAFNTNQISENPPGLKGNAPNQTGQGLGTLIYGAWTVAWCWN